MNLHSASKVMQVSSAKGDIPESHSYFSGKLDGSKSLYIVYSSPDFSRQRKGASQV